MTPPFAAVPQLPVMRDDLTDPGAALAMWHALAPLGAQPEGALVRSVMIATPSGAATVDGLSGGLQTPMDNAVYQTMRMRSELILVTMHTVRREEYGPATPDHRLRHLRDGPASPIWALTRTLRQEDIDYLAGVQHSRTDGGPMELVVSAEEAPPELRSAAASAGVPLRVIPGSRADFLSGAVAAARREAEREIVVESGPTLLSLLLAAGLVDELVLSVSPMLRLPTGRPLLPADWSGEPVESRLRAASAFTAEDGGLYVRWLVGESASV